MNSDDFFNHVSVLKEELVCALGCTEPIAVAFAAALARTALSETPSRLSVTCSGNIIKNVRSVTVPNSDGMRGIEAAATLGCLGGSADALLEVLQSVDEEDIQNTHRLLDAGNYCSVELAEGVPNLYVRVCAYANNHEAVACIRDRHTHVVELSRDGVEVDPQELGLTHIRVFSTNVHRNSAPTSNNANIPEVGVDTTHGVDVALNVDSVQSKEQVLLGENPGGCDICVTRDGALAGRAQGARRSALSLASIWEFAHLLKSDSQQTSGADSLELSEQRARKESAQEISELISKQIEVNKNISDEGLRSNWGANVGSHLLRSRANDVSTVARAAAAAGSDARMSGCALPVMICCGSGNQGITCSQPVFAYAKELHATHEQLIQAVVISDLVAVHVKHYIGELSAFCGAVSAACGAGAGICFLRGGSFEQMEATVVNTLANVGGIVCDGAKPSCAAKVSTAVDAAILACDMALANDSFLAGDGLVGKDAEYTIRSMGHVGRVGMRSTDVEILNIMIGKTDVDAADIADI